MATITVISQREPLVAGLRQHFDAERAEAIPPSHLVQGRLPDAFVLDAQQDEHLPLVDFLSLQTGRPIVVLAPDAPSSVVAAYLEAGADAVLRDADCTGECIARLRALTRRSAAARPVESSYRFGNVVLYPERRSVLRDGVALHFTRTEFNLLSVLAQHLDRVLSHRQLMSEVWGQEFLSARHYLRVYVRRVREKIEADPNQPQLLIAYRAKGYMLRSAAGPESTGGRDGDDASARRAHTQSAYSRVTTYVPSLTG